MLQNESIINSPDGAFYNCKFFVDVSSPLLFHLLNNKTNFLG